MTHELIRELKKGLAVGKQVSLLMDVKNYYEGPEPTSPSPGVAADENTPNTTPEQEFGYDETL